MKDSIGKSALEATREIWLNGWQRDGEVVYKFNTTHCAGCGKYTGSFTVAVTGDEKFPDKEPDWPFDKVTCPICDLRIRVTRQRLVYLLKLAEKIAGQ